MEIEGWKFRTFKTAEPTVEASLQDVDWNEAVKRRKQTELGPAARKYREDTRRGMLASFAPDFILEEWLSDLTPPNAFTAPLPNLHPIAARGVWSLLTDRTFKQSRELSNDTRPLLAGIKARADLTRSP